MLYSYEMGFNPLSIRYLFSGGSSDDELIFICVMFIQQSMQLLKPLNHVRLNIDIN